MLYVLFSNAVKINGVNMKPNDTFDLSMKKEWFNDNMVKQMIWDIDKTKAIKDFYMESTKLGAIPPQWLSGGVKTLILMYKNNYITNLTKLGNNCLPWLFRISKEKDIYCSCSNPHIYFYNVKINVTCLNNGEQIESFEEWSELFSRFLLEYEIKEQENDIMRCIDNVKRGIYRYSLRRYRVPFVF